MFSKILVANRGEIAIRAFRAAYELGAKTVAVFPHEDRNSIHRQKSDEAYPIGQEGHPVRAYLDVDEIVRVAKESGADAIYPGYGFLSENPDLARAADAAGIKFVGPKADILELAGNKVEALRAAKRAGIPTLQSTEPSADREALIEEAEKIGYPLFVKAVAGGGGRGMRRVETSKDLPGALDAAMREADTAFGDPTVFIEQAVLRPGTSKCRSSRTTRAMWCTCSNVTAHSSVATRRLSRSPRRPIWTRTSARPCTATP